MKAAFSLITPNYLSYAKTIGDSILAHNPHYTYFLCIIGKKNDLNGLVNIERFKVVFLNDLEDTRVPVMEQQYTLFELSCALKPYFADHLLSKHPEIVRLKYFDSDMMLFDSFDPLLENDAASIFLTPHFTKAVSLAETGHPNDANLLLSGVYNAGFFEIANHLESRRFLEWWKDRLSNCCFALKPPYQHIFVDQSWLTLVPTYFKGVKIIDHTGYNISFYNLQERTISKKGDEFVVNNNDKLVFFHFTGYKHFQPDVASSHHTKFSFATTPLLRDVCTRYLQQLISNHVETIYPAPAPVSVQTTASNAIETSLPGKVNRFVNRALNKLLKIKIIRTAG